MPPWWTAYVQSEPNPAEASFLTRHLERTIRNRLVLATVSLLFSCLVLLRHSALVATELLGPPVLTENMLLQTHLPEWAETSLVSVQGTRIIDAQRNPASRLVMSPATAGRYRRDGTMHARFRVIEVGAHLVVLADGPPESDGNRMRGRIWRDRRYLGIARSLILDGHAEWKGRLLDSFVLVAERPEPVFAPLLLLSLCLVLAAWNLKLVLDTRRNPSLHPSVRALRRFGEPRAMAAHIQGELARAVLVRRFGEVVLTPSWLLCPSAWRLDCINSVEVVWFRERPLSRHWMLWFLPRKSAVTVARRVGVDVEIVMPLPLTGGFLCALSRWAAWMVRYDDLPAQWRGDRASLARNADVGRSNWLAHESTLGLLADAPPVPDGSLQAKEEDR